MTTNPFYTYTRIPIETITSDPAFRGVWYESNDDPYAALHDHARIRSVMGFSTQFWKNEEWRHLGLFAFELGLPGQIDRYLNELLETPA